jgi:hypothetical protein
MSTTITRARSSPQVVIAGPGGQDARHNNPSLIHVTGPSTHFLLEQSIVECHAPNSCAGSGSRTATDAHALLVDGGASVAILSSRLYGPSGGPGLALKLCGGNAQVAWAQGKLRAQLHARLFSQCSSLLNLFLAHRR